MLPPFPMHRLPFASFLPAFSPREVRPGPSSKLMPGAEEAPASTDSAGGREGEEGCDAEGGRQRGKRRKGQKRNGRMPSIVEEAGVHSGAWRERQEAD
jgi:hypothetical protein